jgi:hypothetical protein
MVSGLLAFYYVDFEFSKDYFRDRTHGNLAQNGSVSGDFKMPNGGQRNSLSLFMEKSDDLDICVSTMYRAVARGHRYF